MSDMSILTMLCSLRKPRIRVVKIICCVVDRCVVDRSIDFNVSVFIYFHCYCQYAVTAALRVLEQYVVIELVLAHVAESFKDSLQALYHTYLIQE